MTDSVGSAVRKFSEQISSVFTPSSSANGGGQQQSSSIGESASSSLNAGGSAQQQSSAANPVHSSHQTILSAANQSKTDLTGRNGSSRNPPIGNGVGSAFTVSVSSAFNPCLDVFAIWLDGLPIEQAVDLLLEKKATCTGVFPSAATITDVERRIRCRQFVLSQYRSFGMMEHYLHKPRAFGDQFLFALPAHIKRKLIEMFYGFEENVVRELLGKKLNYRSRKDLDDVCGKTQVSLGSCRRQFDNIKRISKKVEEAQGSMVMNVERKFLLPRQLAAKYAHIIFLTSNRIDIGKKKLSQFTFEDFEYCSSVFMQYWTVKSPTAIEEFDAKLVQDLRDLKALLFGSGAAPSLSFNVSSNPGKEIYEQLKSLTFEYMATKAAEAGSSSLLTQSMNTGPSFSFALFGQQLNLSGTATTNTNTSNVTAINTNTKQLSAIPSSPVSPTQQKQFQMPTITKDFASTFKTIIRNAFTIGIGLTHPKEVRLLFVNLLEKIVEPCVSAGWREQDIDAFFSGLKHAWLKLSEQSRQLQDETTNVVEDGNAKVQTRTSTSDSNNRTDSDTAPQSRPQSQQQTSQAPATRTSLSMSLAGRLSLIGGESLIRTLTINEDEDVFERYGDTWDRIMSGVHLSALKLSNDLSVALA